MLEVKISGWDVAEVQREAKSREGFEVVASGKELRGGRQWHTITLQRIDSSKVQTRDKG